MQFYLECLPRKDLYSADEMIDRFINEIEPKVLAFIELMDDTMEEFLAGKLLADVLRQSEPLLD